MITLRQKFQRIELQLQAISLGGDWQIILSGGARHVGAVVLAQPCEIAQVLTVGIHKEGEMSRELAELCANSLGCNIAFSCGIHYDNISKAEIKIVILLARQLVSEFINSIKK